MRLDCLRLGMLAALLVGVAACGSDGQQGPAGVAGPAGASGDKGDPGSAGTAGQDGTAAEAAVLTVPADAMLDRETRVTFTLVGATLGSDVIVKMGDAVTITNVEKIGDNSFSARVRPEAAALVGARDIEIVTGGKTLKSSKSFNVKAPLRVGIAGGVPTQGGLLMLDFYNDDRTPFDPGSIRLLTTGFGGYVDATSMGISAAGTTAARALVLLDTSAPSNVQFSLGNYALKGENPDVTFYSAPNAVKVAPRQATVLTPGTPLIDQVPGAAQGTQLYKLAAGTAALASISVTGTGTGAHPAMYLLSNTGKGTEMLAYQGIGLRANTPPSKLMLPVNTTIGDYNLIVADRDGRNADAAAIGWSVTTTSVPATAVSEMAGDHTTGATAQALSAAPSDGPFVVTAANSFYEADVYRADFTSAGKLGISIVTRNYFTTAPLDTIEISSDPTFPANATDTLNLHNDDRIAATLSSASTTTHYIRIKGDWTTPYFLSVWKE